MTPEQAIAFGVGYLRRLARDGRWTEFRLYPGPSDEWVTGYVAATLAEAGVPECDDLVAQALAALAGRQRPDGRFGFNSRSVGDADSTLWALRLAGAVQCDAGERGAGERGAGERGAGGCGAGVGLDRGAAERALAEHVRAGGGVATYAADEPIRTIVQAPSEHPMAGWCSAHPCVTAVAAGTAATAAPASGYLLANQCPDGSWLAYWWVDREYSVAHAAEALAVRCDPGSARAVARAADWAGSRLGDDGVVRTRAYPEGSPFATALALRAALAARYVADPRRPDRLGRTAEWLCRGIRLDGSWQPSALLRVPHPHDAAPDRPGGTEWVPGGLRWGAVATDLTAAFTTATVLAALARYLSAVEVPIGGTGPSTTSPYVA